jgi:FKBP-type peptidyl-prolyl cis-trans isomerase FkpA
MQIVNLKLIQMKLAKQIGIIVIILSAIILFNSCLKDDTQETRTAETEIQELNKYINDLITNGHDVDTTELGVYYVLKKEGEGNFPNEGDTVSIGYAGYFTNGVLFDSSSLNNEDDSFTFRFIVDPMIPGFEDGIKLLNKGAEMEMIVPSRLAYGAYGNQRIPSYTSLVFVVTLKELKPLVAGD